MANALILHGTGSNPGANWLPWLRSKFERTGYEVTIPRLPEAQRPNFARYWKVIQDFPFGRSTVVVGHSSGATTSFRILEQLSDSQHVGLVVSVAGFHRDEGFNCEELTAAPFDWEKIRSATAKIVLVASPDDPYISMEQTEYLAAKLNVEPILMPGSLHFGVLSGGARFTSFPELWEIIAAHISSDAGDPPIHGKPHSYGGWEAQPTYESSLPPPEPWGRDPWGDEN